MSYTGNWFLYEHVCLTSFLQAAKYGDAAEAADNQAWATGQIGQLLGDGLRSYVVGYGNNPPERPHHRSR